MRNLTRSPLVARGLLSFYAIGIFAEGGGGIGGIGPGTGTGIFISFIITGTCLLFSHHIYVDKQRPTPIKNPTKQSFITPPSYYLFLIHLIMIDIIIQLAISAYIGSHFIEEPEHEEDELDDSYQ